MKALAPPRSARAVSPVTVQSRATPLNELRAARVASVGKPLRGIVAVRGAARGM